MKGLSVQCSPISERELLYLKVLTIRQLFLLISAVLR